MDLPEDVFEPGDVKPQRVTKRKGGNKQAKKENTANGIKEDARKRKLEDDQTVGTIRPALSDLWDLSCVCAVLFFY